MINQKQVNPVQNLCCSNLPDQCLFEISLIHVIISIDKFYRINHQKYICFINAPSILYEWGCCRSLSQWQIHRRPDRLLRRSSLFSRHSDLIQDILQLFLIKKWWSFPKVSTDSTALWISNDFQIFLISARLSLSLSLVVAKLKN